MGKHSDIHCDLRTTITKQFAVLSVLSVHPQLHILDQYFLSLVMLAWI